jgi:hypothetical protein
MRTISVFLSIGYPQADRRWDVEVDDAATDEEIDEIVKEDAHQYIEYGWTEK